MALPERLKRKRLSGYTLDGNKRMIDRDGLAALEREHTVMKLCLEIAGTGPRGK